MELKQPINNLSLSTVKGFNRTFMELKLKKALKGWTSYIVLIVPLWN